MSQPEEYDAPVLGSGEGGKFLAGTLNSPKLTGASEAKSLSSIMDHGW